MFRDCDDTVKLLVHGVGSQTDGEQLLLHNSPLPVQRVWVFSTVPTDTC